MKSPICVGKEAEAKPFRALGKEGGPSLTATLRDRSVQKVHRLTEFRANGRVPSNKGDRTSLTGDDGMGFELAGKKGADIPMGAWVAASAKLEMRC